METYKGKAYIAKDNSYSENLDGSGRVIMLSGTSKLEDYPQEATIISNPYKHEAITCLGKPLTVVMIDVICRGVQMRALFFEDCVNASMDKAIERHLMHVESCKEIHNKYF